MKKLKVIIIDDEEAARITLVKLLEWNDPDVEVIALCANADEGKIAIKNLHPDIVFLDIEMPVKNGFDLLKELPNIDFEVIFVTAYDQFAIEAFKQHAIAYLLKPVDEDELKVSLERARKQMSTTLNEETLTKLFESLQKQQPAFNKIAIPTLDGLELIKVENIIRCSSDGNYTYIYHGKREPLLVSKTLKQIEEQLRGFSQFIRVHHSHVVNLFFVKRYRKGKGGSLVLEDDTIIPVSRSRKDTLLSQFE